MSLNTDLLQLPPRHTAHINHWLAEYSWFLSDKWKATPAARAVQLLARRSARHSRGDGSGNPWSPAGQPPSCSTLLIQGNTTHRHQGWKARKARKFFGEIGTSQFTLNGFVWAERRGLGLAGDASAFYVNPTHTWPIFCCSERTVTIYLIQTQQLLGYIWTS